MDEKLESEDFKKRFPDIVKIINKLPDTYTLKEKLCISLYSLKKLDDVEKILLYIYPISITDEFNKITRTESQNMLGISRSKLNQGDIKKLMGDIITQESNKEDKKLDEELKKAPSNKEKNKKAKAVVNNRATRDAEIHELNQPGNDDEDGAIGAGADGQQIREEPKQNTSVNRPKRISFDDLFKRKSLDEIKTILNNPSKETQWTNINSIDTNGNTVIT